MTIHNVQAKLADPLPLPPHYNPDKVDDVWIVPYQQRAEEAKQWARQHLLLPVSKDDYKIALVAVDMQNTFCHPGFELFVGGRSGMGAVADSRRLCEFIYHNLGWLTQITLTLDTHKAMQIFHSIFLVNDDGEHHPPFTKISYEDVESGRWMFNPEVASSLDIQPEAGQRYLLYYTQQLEQYKKYNLTIWPYHAMLGGIGHALVSSVEEAVFFHSIARNTQPDFEIKGNIALTESYSAIGPEVLTGLDGDQISKKNNTILHKLMEFDAVVIAGEAKSHCVAWTIEDLLIQVQAHDPNLTGKIYLLEDCSSAVVIPGVVDYTDSANNAYQRFAEAGMHIVLSTDLISSWF